MLAASKTFRKISVSQRNCLYPDEKKLSNFESYNFHNCMVECKMYLALKYCGCIPFYIHNKGSRNKHQKVCTLNEIPCLTEQEHFIYNDSYYKNGSDTSNSQGTNKICECLPDCENVFYMSQSSKGILDPAFSTNRFTIYGGEPLENRSVVRVFFTDLIGRRHRREVVFTWHTLLAYYGGILGLFTGFNFISLIEIIYFFSIRLIRELLNINMEPDQSVECRKPKHINIIFPVDRIKPKESLKSTSSPIDLN